MKVRFSLLMIVLLGLVACAQGSTDSELPVIEYVNFKVYDPVYIAIDKGFFTERGVEIRIIGDTLAGPTAIQAVASGSAHAGLSSIPAIINANAAGLPVIGVSDIQSALPGQPLEYYYVRTDSGIDTLDDLAGKRFAVNLWNSSFHYTALMALGQDGVDEESLQWQLLSFPDQIPALASGEVDVIGLMEPYNAYALAEYGDQFTLLFDASDVFGEKQFSVHFLNRIWAEEHPELAEAFVGGVVDAIDWIGDNPEEAKSIIAAYTGVDEQYVADYLFQENGAVILDDVQFWLDYLSERGDLTADWLLVEGIATNQYNPYLNGGSNE